MKLIKLTNCNKESLVDDDDYERLITMCTWFITKDGYAAGSQNLGIRLNKSVRIHRVVLNLESNTTHGLVVDHINRIKLDNQKHNLRLISIRENVLNTNKIPQKAYYDKRRNTWKACVRRYNKLVQIGKVCKTKEDAIKLYDDNIERILKDFEVSYS